MMGFVGVGVRRYTRSAGKICLWWRVMAIKLDPAWRRIIFVGSWKIL
jgi:hypothetical protein